MRRSCGKENFSKQLVSDANYEMTSSIAAGETSFHSTAEKVESALAVAASIQSCVGNEDSNNHNDGQSIQHAVQLAAETVMKNSSKNDHIVEADEHDSPSRRNSYIDWTPSSAESIRPEICKTNMLNQESLKTRPTS